LSRLAPTSAFLTQVGLVPLVRRARPCGFGADFGCDYRQDQRRFCSDFGRDRGHQIRLAGYRISKRANDADKRPDLRAGEAISVCDEHDDGGMVPVHRDQCRVLVDVWEARSISAAMTERFIIRPWIITTVRMPSLSARRYRPRSVLSRRRNPSGSPWQGRSFQARLAMCRRLSAKWIMMCRRRGSAGTPDVNTGGSLWDVAVWDVASWAPSSVPNSTWQTLNGIGQVGSMAMKLSLSQEFVLNSIDVMYEPGGLF
jgi:hypothetical protein